jgi:hypothetical protein
MIFEKLGILLKKNTKTRAWWAKLAIALVFSNIFFFLLFGSDSEVKQESGVPEGWVEVQLSAELMTPFHLGKKVLIVHRNGRKKLEGVLQASGNDLGKITVLVKEDEAHALFQFEAWEVLPYLKHLTFASATREGSHEIRY